MDSCSKPAAEEMAHIRNAINFGKSVAASFPFGQIQESLRAKGRVPEGLNHDLASLLAIYGDVQGNLSCVRSPRLLSTSFLHGAVLIQLGGNPRL